MRPIPTAIARSTIAIALLATLGGCPKKKHPPAAPAAVGETAIVVRNFDAGLAADFSFANTIAKILTSAGIADTPANREALVKTMVLSFNANQFTNPLNSLPMAVAPRGSDAAISAADLLNPSSGDGLIPIGLFNRLDLAPADWSDCGEHRIVYATKPGGKRIFVIFEAKLPNPDAAAGKQGCRAVAQRWADVSTAAPAQRNALLKEFYYAGMPGFRSVVDFLNYGSFLGQVRTNILGQNPWQLREFRALAVAPGQIAFSPAPVASNPLASFYRENPIGSPLEQSERTAFQAKFAAEYLNNLRSVDATEPAAATADQFKRKLMNAMGGGFEARSNEFQSDSQLGNQMPEPIAGATIKAGVPLSWNAPVGTRTISQAELLNRAGAVTCGGCHGLSSGRPIGSFNGAPITWPNVAPGGFVHISENEDGAGNHEISEALSQFFIPFRQEVTNDILNTTTAMAAPKGITALAALLIPRANAQPASPNQPAAPSREEAERAALELLRARVDPAGARQASATTRRNSDLAHAREQSSPGAYVEFRRPH